MNISKKAALFMVLLLFVSGIGQSAYADEMSSGNPDSENLEITKTEKPETEKTAETESEKEYDSSRYYQGDKISLSPDYNLPSGGKNKIGDKSFSTRNEAIVAESELRRKGYVLVNTNAKEISDEDLEILQNSSYWFCSYLERSKKNITWMMDKVYIYKPLLNNYLKEYREDGIVSYNTSYQIMTKTIIFAYSVYYFNDKVGTVSDVFNDNIPDYLTGAYMEINSPINVEVTLLSWGAKCYYKFYVSKNTPFMVKLPENQYKVVGINTVEIGQKEPAMPLHNMVYLTEKEYGDRDNPYVMDITPVINKYIIPEVDISGMPDLSIDQNQNIPEERTVVDQAALEAARQRSQEEIDREATEKEEKTVVEENSEEEEKKRKLYAAGFITIIGVILYGLINKIKRFKKGGKGNENIGDGQQPEEVENE